jgi:hypothetical protein
VRHRNGSCVGGAYLWGETRLKLIIFYLLAIAAGLATVLVLNVLHQLPPVLAPIAVAITCAAVGGIGGCIYCLRGVYLNACVLKRWDNDWRPWYYIRPLVSIACGGVSYIFLRAGLLVLESGQKPDSTDVGFFALAFVAGLNVDKFITKIEDIAQAVWGIEKSRAAAVSSAASVPAVEGH